MIPDADRPRPFRAENEPIFYAKNHVGMPNCTETIVRRFSDRRSVLVPSPYAYQKASWLVLAWEKFTLPGVTLATRAAEDRKPRLRAFFFPRGDPGTPGVFMLATAATSPATTSCNFALNNVEKPVFESISK